MAEILRSWRCLNHRCGNTFDAWEANPACPECGNVRVDWLPGGGHVGGTARSVDAEFRALADAFKLTDLASPSRGERAMPALKTPPSAAPAGPQMQFAPGFATTVPYVIGQDGRPHGVCMPSAQNVNFKARLGVGEKLSGSGRFPGIATNTVIDMKHRG